MNNRERFSSRLGFILISAGCAVGLGNVWRFPYITGQYGGAAFVLVYLIFLVLLGLPIMVMEFAVGRASQKSAARSFHVLEPAGTKWHLQGYACMAGNYLLMMFYTTVGGWMAAYIFKTLTGEFKGLDSDGVAAVFNDMLARPGYMTFWMVLVVLLSFFICSLGLQKGVERITKAMMSCLFLILLILCIRSVTLPGASEGLRFYLIPDFTRFTENGVGNTIFAAMGQAFFTLSLGIGAMAIFGSYIGKDHTLTGETINICLLDTLVAFLAGLIIFPSCFAFGVDPGQGPGLVFITLPNIFNQMVGGRIFGVLFFVFMTFAAQSTIIAVFENIISFSMDLFGTSRKKNRPDQWNCDYPPVPALRIRLQHLVRFPADGRWLHDSGSRGLHCFQQPPAPGQHGLSAVLYQQIRLGLEKLPGRSRHRQGRKIPRLGARLRFLYSAADRPVHFYYGLLSEI